MTPQEWTAARRQEALTSPFWPTLCTRDQLDAICRQVAQKHHVRIDQIKGPRRYRQVILARHEAMKRARFELRLSLPQIGRYFGRHHTTVMDAVRKDNAIPDAPA